MQFVQQPQEMRRLVRPWRQATGSSLPAVALVPTMGALHAGHMRLVDEAKRLAQRVVLSIFVNPLQFGPHEDYQAYPRHAAADLPLCQSHGVDVVFSPPAEAIYPFGLDAARTFTITPPEALVSLACGATRPRHFTGVSTVVFKLFQIVQPQVLVFGEKDAQQLAVVRRMCQDLHLPVALHAAPVVREASGLAMSSRNAYFAHDAVAMEAALALYAALRQVAAHVRGTHHVATAATLEDAWQTTLAGLGDAARLRLALDYFIAVDDETFTRVDTLQPGTRLLIAAWVSVDTGARVRLIDTLLLK